MTRLATRGAPTLLDGVARAILGEPMKVVAHPDSYALSVIRRLARQHRVISDDDVLRACNAVGVTAADRQGALDEACRRYLVMRVPGRVGHYRSRLYGT